MLNVYTISKLKCVTGLLIAIVSLTISVILLFMFVKQVSLLCVCLITIMLTIINTYPRMKKEIQSKYVIDKNEINLIYKDSTTIIKWNDILRIEYKGHSFFPINDRMTLISSSKKIEISYNVIRYKDLWSDSVRYTTEHNPKAYINNRLLKRIHAG